MTDEAPAAGQRWARRALTLGCLIIAGEAIFSLPFHVARFFRPTLLSVFKFTNTQLGAVQGCYGVVAMIAYFPGGPLADRFSARKLLAASLASTALGGLYFSTFPSQRGMWLLFGYFGLTTILLFWAALIRATREWGGKQAQGKAYGILDGGRGLLAAVLATLVVLLFSLWYPDDPAAVTDALRAAALRNIILFYSGVTMATAALVWLFVPEEEGIDAEASKRPAVLAGIGQVLRQPAVWLQAVIVVCAYVAYKGIDNYSLYAVQGFQMNEVEGAGVSTMGAWVRPVACIGAGYIGDHVRCSRVIVVSFLLLTVSYTWSALVQPDPAATWVLYVNVLLSCSGAYALRAVYFALFEEASVSTRVTGTAVGLVSVLGYTPDIFVSPTTGWLLDRSPGLLGHQHFFYFMLAFAVCGLVASVMFRGLVSGANPTRA